MSQKIGILPLARPTFDVSYAEEKLQEVLDILKQTGNKIVGSFELLMDEDTARASLEDLRHENIDHLLVLQLTFTDASIVVQAGQKLQCPLSIWSIPEPRSGKRLRLNSFCGLNLASHALGLNERAFSWFYKDPTTTRVAEINGLFEGNNKAGRLSGKTLDNVPNEPGEQIFAALKGKRIARIGEHPTGFDTCAYDKSKMKQLSGVNLDELELETLFDAANGVDEVDLKVVKQSAEKSLKGLDDVNQSELDKSLKLKVALDQIRSSGKYDAFAIRCWPETFTEYGGAVCGPVSMMGEARIPCACEADVYGALTQIILQEVANAPVFLTDLVDVDTNDGTGVVWHCGQAPLSMCATTTADATIHTNRKMPLLYEFPLKPGPVTFMRISQAFGEVKMVMSLGHMLEKLMAFTGTSGVFEFENAADESLNRIISSGLEHHMALAYGDHRPALRSVAKAMKLPVLEI